MADRPTRGDVFLVDLSLSRGREIQKTRPCIVVSPDELNANMGTFIIAPLTTGGYPYPFRVACSFQGKPGHVVLDQLRTVDRGRMVKQLGTLDESSLGESLKVLQAMFAP
ncbi:MAG TPA: type II toxin-antitoxin system PemK/MazF family toxin [Alkalispirochaeta sp.]|nr:type II toxin-antitoxin system PemK/MazF family toxin [Alkalispirochaeta sp.]